MYLPEGLLQHLPITDKYEDRIKSAHRLIQIRWPAAGEGKTEMKAGWTGGAWWLDGISYSFYRLQKRN